MSAIKNILKLLLIFEDDKNVYTSKELAEEVGVTTRQIRNYIKELRDFGYVIESDATRGGGYRSAGQYIDIPLKISRDELRELGRTVAYLEQNHVFEDYLTLKNLYFKICKFHKIHIDDKNQFDYKLQYHQKHEIGENNILKKIGSAISDNKKVKINYFSAKGKSEEYRTIHPYKIQFYQGANYIHAFCEKAQDYRIFKLLRIRNAKTLDMKFQRKKEIETKIDSQNFGIFTEESLRIKLAFSYPYNEFAKEIIIGEEQKIEVIDDMRTSVEARINNQTELIGWIMSFGKSVKVIYPEKLREKIILHAQETFENYF
jgi:predicted DNA-binding transcriptional regulator YafY